SIQKAVVSKMDSVSKKTTSPKVQVVDTAIDSITRLENKDTITKVLVPIADSVKVSTVNKKASFKDSITNQQIIADSTLKATTDTNQVEIFKFSPTKSKSNDSVKAVVATPIDSTLGKKSSTEISNTEIKEPQAPVILKDTVVLIDSSSGTIWKDSVVIYYKQ